MHPYKLVVHLMSQLLFVHWLLLLLESPVSEAAVKAAAAVELAGELAPEPSPPRSVIDGAISRLQLSLKELEHLKRGLGGLDPEPAPDPQQSASHSTCSSPGRPPDSAQNAGIAVPGRPVESGSQQPQPDRPPPSSATDAPATPLPVPPLSEDVVDGAAGAAVPAAPSPADRPPPPREQPAAGAGSQPDRPISGPSDTGQPPTRTAGAPLPAQTPAPAPTAAPDPPPSQAPAAQVPAQADTQTVPSAAETAPAASAPEPDQASPPSPAGPLPATGDPAGDPPVVMARDMRSAPTEAPAPTPPPDTEMGEPSPPPPPPSPASSELLPETAPAAADNGTVIGGGGGGTSEEALWPPEAGSGEDIQPFNEWASRRVEETQKKTAGDTVSPAGPGAGSGPAKKPPVRHRIKNYASPDCGAKVLAANPGAASASNVLSPGRDEYMLNSCDTRVWFVIELCEGIQASRLELSNDELYSSSPREFAVYLTDRYPTREWNKVGQFTAESRRGPQSFHLPTVVFGKFVKVEILSHYGSHYYCTVSNVLVYGASEYEVLDHQDSESHESESSDYEELMEPIEPTDRPNLLNRALQAVNSMVQTAKVALTGQGGSGGGSARRCLSLDPGQLPANISADQRLELGCRFDELSAVGAGRLFRFGERRCRLCGPLAGDRQTPHGSPCGLTRALLPADTLRLVCAVRSLLPPAAAEPAPATAPAGPPTTSGSSEPPTASEMPPPSPPAGDRPAAAATATAAVPPADIPPAEDIAPSAAGNGSSVLAPAADPAGAGAAPVPAAAAGGDGGPPAEEAAEGEPPPTTAEPPPAQKESVFVRLSNRIKALELNMSLSQQYLDELSRRYKKQVEEMQKTFNKTIAALEVTARDAESRDELQQQMIRSLQSQILNLTTAVAGVLAEKETITWKLVQRHMILMVVEVLVLSLALLLCLRRRTAAGRPGRQSVQVARHDKAAPRRPPRDAAAAADSGTQKHHRRPSDEVVNISGTYRSLLLPESRGAEPASARERRATRLVRSLSTWSVGSEEGQQLAVPGVGVLFAEQPPSPAVAFVSRRGAAAGRAAVSNPYSPLRRLENGDGVAAPDSLTNGHCPPPAPPPAPAGGGGGREPRPSAGRRAERRRLKKKLSML